MPIDFKPHRRPAPVPPPATVTAANNGTSLSGTTVQLGQNVGAVGNPGQLLNNREIPLSNFGVDFKGNLLNVSINDTTGDFLASDAAGNPFIQYRASNTYVSIGDDFVIGNGVELFVWDANNKITAAVNLNGVANAQCLQLDGASGTFALGDTGNNNNNTQIFIDDINQRAAITAVAVGQEYFTVDPLNAIYSLGDLPGLVDNTFLYLDANVFEIDNAGNVAISTELAQGRYKFGDIGGVTNGMQLFINNQPLIKEIFLGTSIGNGTNFVLNDNSGNFFFDNAAHNSVININGSAGFTGTVTPVNSITVVGGIVTAVS